MIIIIIINLVRISHNSRKSQRAQCSVVNFMYHIYSYKRPGGDAFFKRRATRTDEKNQLSSPVAMGDNGHLRP